MLDMSWSEILVIMVVALVVIGPKDLPKVIREVGKWTGKARSMAREFQRSFDDMVREAELDEIRQSLDKARPGNLKNTIRDMVDPDGDLKRAFDLHADDKKPAEQPKAGEATVASADQAGPPAHLPGSPAPEAKAGADPTADAPRYEPHESTAEMPMAPPAPEREPEHVHAETHAVPKKPV